MSSSKIHKCIGLVCQSHQNNQSTSGSVGKGRLVPMQRGRSPTQARVAHTKGDDCTHDVCPVPAFFRPKKRANIGIMSHFLSFSLLFCLQMHCLIRVPVWKYYSVVHISHYEYVWNLLGRLRPAVVGATGALRKLLYINMYHVVLILKVNVSVSSAFISWPHPVITAAAGRGQNT